MVTRRDIGFMLVGGVSGATAAYAAATGREPTVVGSRLGGGDPMQQSFPVSGEFAEVRWRDSGWIEIVTEPDADGVSIALAVGDVSDPLSGDHVSSNITERGEIVEFGLAEAIRKRGFEKISIGSYSVQGSETARTAERLDVVTVTVPDPVLSSVGSAE